MDKDSILRQIQEVDGDPRCEDWAAKVVFICECFWPALGDPALIDACVSPATMPAFISLLRKQDSFSLAQQVIPELRSAGEIAVASEYQASVLAATKSLRDRDSRLRSMTQDTFDSKAYKEEKKIFREAEEYRVRLYLHTCGRFSAEEEKEINEWLDKCPSSLRQRSRENDRTVSNDEL